MLQPLNDVFLGSTIINGQPTVIFPSQPYTRLVLSIYVTCTASGSVAAYRGLIGGAAVDGNPFGSNQRLTSRYPLPAGQVLFVVWNVPSTASANARLQAMRYST